MLPYLRKSSPLRRTHNIFGIILNLTFLKVVKFKLENFFQFIESCNFPLKIKRNSFIRKNLKLKIQSSDFF